MTESLQASCSHAGSTSLASPSPFKPLSNQPYIFIGIDPGFTGAIAVHDTAFGFWSVHDMPVTVTSTKIKTKKGNFKTRTDLDIEALCFHLDTIIDMADSPQQIHVTIEKAQPMGASKNGRTQGVQSTARYMEAYGMVIGSLAALNLPYTTITAAKWKKDMGVSADKDLAMAEARRMFPDLGLRLLRKMDHGRAEAALICYYGMKMRGILAEGE